MSNATLVLPGLGITARADVLGANTEVLLQRNAAGELFVELPAGCASQLTFQSYVAHNWMALKASYADTTIRGTHPLDKNMPPQGSADWTIVVITGGSISVEWGGDTIAITVNAV